MGSFGNRYGGWGWQPCLRFSTHTRPPARKVGGVWMHLLRIIYIMLSELFNIINDLAKTA